MNMQLPGGARGARQEDVATPMFWEPSHIFLQMAIIGLLVGPTAFLIATFTVMPEQQTRAGGPLLMIMVALIAWIPLARGNFRACIAILVFGTWAAVTGISAYNGGVRATVVIAYPLIIVMSGWLLGARTAIVLAGLTIAATLIFGLAEMKGVLPAQPPTHPAMYWAVQLIVFIFSAALLAYLVRSYKNRLNEVHQLSSDLARRDVEAKLAESLRKSADLLDRTGKMARVGGWELEVSSESFNWTAEVFRILDLPPGQPPSLPEALQLFAPEGRPLLEQALRQAIADGTPCDLELPVITGQGRSIWVRAMAQPEMADGRVVRLVGAMQDITGQRLSEQRMKDSIVNLQRTLDATGDGIFGYDGRDPSGRLLFANDQFFRMWNIPPEDAAKTGRAEIIEAVRKLLVDPDAGVERINEILAMPMPHEDRITLLDGRVIRRRSVPISGSNGVSRVWSFRDVTIEERAVQALRESEQRLNRAQQVAHLGSFDLKPLTGELEWSDEHFRLWGLLPKSHSPDYALFRQGIHPDDLARVEATLQQVMRDGGHYDCLHRVVWPDGSEHHVRALGEVICNETGQAVRIIGTVQDVSERVAAEQALISARDEAERANLAKSEFLATMSHEIRTPMNGVLGMAELLRSTRLDATQQRYLDTVSHSGRHLLGIINDILDFSKIESGHLVLEAVELNLGELVEETAAPFAQSAQKKGLELVTELSPADRPMLLRGDPVRLRQVLSNLISNAIKFTQHGEVVVRAEALAEAGTDCRIRLTVADTGVGIAPEAVGRVFEQFTQADGSTTRRYGGTGLGLAICRRLVGLMGGYIRVDSAPGQGARFSVDLALPFAAGATGDAGDVAAVATVAASVAQLQEVRVLLVDDNPTQLGVLRKQLAAWRMQVSVASGGALALSELRAAAREARPCQLVLIDWQMPAMNGLQLAQAIRGEPELAASRLILLAATDQAGRQPAWAQEGISHCLAKPIRQGELLHTLLAAMQPALASTGATAGRSEGGEPRPLAGGSESLRGRVLLVEDNPINQELTELILAGMGLAVELANNGEEALSLLARAHFDLVLMDCQMPVMDGYQATGILRRREHGSSRRLPVVALTANALAGDRAMCLAAGMDDYVAKPYTYLELRNVIGRWLPLPANLPSAPLPPTEIRPEPHTLAPMSSIDIKVLDQYRALDPAGGFGLASQIMQVYLKHSPENLDQAERAIAGADADALRRTAHILKSSTANVGGLSLAALFNQLEGLGKAGQLDEATLVFDQAKREYSRLRGELDALLAEVS